jgi:hypothetical protein
MSERREIIVSTFPCRCPYCDGVVEYCDLQPGGHHIRCEQCQQEYIKIVGSFQEAPQLARGETNLRIHDLWDSSPAIGGIEPFEKNVYPYR